MSRSDYWIVRFGKLLVSIWMIVDMIMDVLTNIKYYEFARVSLLKVM